MRNTETTISVIYTKGTQNCNRIQDVVGIQDWQVGREGQRELGRTHVCHLLSLGAHMVLPNALLNCHIVFVYIILKIYFIKSIFINYKSHVRLHKNFSVSWISYRLILKDKLLHLLFKWKHELISERCFHYLKLLIKNYKSYGLILMLWR